MIIWGFRKRGHPEWSGLLKCASCDRWRLHHGVRTKRQMTVFFVPLVPLWSDRQSICAVCLRREKLDRDAFDALGETARRNVDLADRYRDAPAELQRQLARAADETAPIAQTA